MISEAVYDTLLGHLYAGAAAPQRLSLFLSALGTATESHVTSFLREEFENPSASTFLSSGAGPEEILRYSEYMADNLWFQRSLPEVHSGAVFNGDQYVSRKELIGSRYYDGFLRHIDTQHSVGICAAYQQQRGAFLTLCRSAGSGEYDQEDMQLFCRLAPHVVNAFAMQVQFEHLNAQASQAIRHQRGLFLLDAQWRWVGGNPVAEQMIAAGWWRGRLKASLEAVHPITRAAWKALQSRLTHEAAAQIVVPVHDAKGGLVAFASVHAYGAAAIGENIPCYVVFVRPLHLAQTNAVDAQLRQLFGLTGAEAAFTLALRAHGDAAQAAAAVGIAGSSARTRLQSVFEKTGTHRQADLMLMVDALAETIA